MLPLSFERTMAVMREFQVSIRPVWVKLVGYWVRDFYPTNPDAHVYVGSRCCGVIQTPVMSPYFEATHFTHAFENIYRH